jgi:hypothetical protein
MKRLLTTCALALSFVAVGAPTASAEVKTKDKAQVKFEGTLGRMINLFAGKAAKEGLVSSNAVKGDRKATFDDSMGRIVDLREEKIYELDMKKKTYKVTTFDEVRRQLKEAQEKAEKARAEQPQQEQQPQQKPDKELEVDFDVKETGQKKSIAGYEARQVVMTATVREKGKTLEESGGLVLTADNWLGPDIPALKEMAEFEMRYWKAIAPETAAVSAEQMAAVIAMYPMVKQAMERMNKEKVNMSGTPLATTMTFEGVKSKDQIAQEAQSSNSSGGGLSGMLARRMLKKDTAPRATFMTINTETLEVATTVAPTDIDIPAGFKQKN